MRGQPNLYVKVEYMAQFKGTWTALVTPFRNGDIDWSSLKKLVHNQLDAGIEGFVISGTTGESPTLTKEEKKNIFLFIKNEVSAHVPLMLGTGTNSTAETIEATREAESLGADAALVVVPYYNKPPQRGLFEHYKQVAQNTSLPIMLYNVPGRTVASLELETIKQLSEIKNIIGIKEATGNIEFGSKILSSCHKDFIVLSGDDGTTVELCYEGGHGVISVLSHIIPKEFKDLVDRAISKDKASIDDFKKYVELTKHLFSEANPIPVKAALQSMNIIENDELRLPLCKMDSDKRNVLENEMKRLALL